MALPCRFARPDDTEAIMAFFRETWGTNHIFGRDREMLEWQFGKRGGDDNGALNALTVWDGARLVGMQGLVATDFTCGGHIAPGLWLCNLMAAESHRDAGVGLQLMMQVHRLNANVIATAGINPALFPAYKKLRYTTLDRLLRYVRIIDPDAMAHELGVTVDDALVGVAQRGRGALRMEPISRFDAEWDVFWRAYSSADYFGVDRTAAYMNWRYTDHRRFEYRSFAIYDQDDGLVGAAVVRVERALDRDVCVLRVLEIFGRSDLAIAGVVECLEVFAREVGAAFLDHYASCDKFDAGLRHAGWFEECDDPNVVIPTLFQPILAERRDIRVAVRLVGETPMKSLPWSDSLYVVKSDGDQDRPN